MTDSTFVALGYSAEADWKSSNRYVFVNEVLESDRLETFKFDLGDVKVVDVKPKHLFKKYVHMWSPQPTRGDYKFDFKGRRYVNTPGSSSDEYVAKASVIIPRYMIEINQDKDTKKEIKLTKDNKLGLLFAVPAVVFSFFFCFKTKKLLVSK